MKVIELPLEKLREATWNPNQMDGAMLARLRESIKRYGVVENLVVRPLGIDEYEVLSGNQRLIVLRDRGIATAPCVIADLDDAQARLLTQALNHIQGEDDLGLRAELVREVLKSMSSEEILSIMPETATSLAALATLGQENMAAYLQNWQRAKAARLKHMQFQFTRDQLTIVEQALAQIEAEAKQSQIESPNLRSTSLYLLCKHYMEKEADL